MQIIDGRKIAQQILLKVKSEVARLSFQPVFCDILVGENPVSTQYVNLKAKKAQSVGIKFLRADFVTAISAVGLMAEIEKLNRIKNMCGLIVQLPLPGQLARQEVLDKIAPEIDVDCMGAKRSEDFYSGILEIVPPTAAAILAILDSLKMDLGQKNILVVGQGELVGKPICFLLKQRGLEVNIADIFTPNTLELMQEADVIISATGKPGLIVGEKIKQGCIIIDAGTAEAGGEIVGDVDIESVKAKAGAVSPVPGGVGPVTVAMLLKNILTVAKQKQV